MRRRNRRSRRVSSRISTRRLCAVTLLELLTAPAPARVVAAELLVRGRLHDARRRRNAGRDRLAASRFRNRLRALRRLVLVLNLPVRRLRLRQLLVGNRLELRVEQVQDDLAADRRAELVEHPLALARVLDERILL